MRYREGSPEWRHPRDSAGPRPAAPHLPGSHVAAEGIGVAAASRVQRTLVDGDTDAAIPTPALVARAVVGALGPRDTLSL